MCKLRKHVDCHMQAIEKQCFIHTLENMQKHFATPVQMWEVYICKCPE